MKKGHSDALNFIKARIRDFNIVELTNNYGIVIKYIAKVIRDIVLKKNQEF